MKFKFGGFSVSTAEEAVKFLKVMIREMKEINLTGPNARTMLTFAGVGVSLENMPEFDDKDVDHYKMVLIELLDAFQEKIGGKND